jgi:hypothetical protein
MYTVYTIELVVLPLYLFGTIIYKKTMYHYTESIFLLNTYPTFEQLYISVLVGLIPRYCVDMLFFKVTEILLVPGGFNLTLLRTSSFDTHSSHHYYHTAKLHIFLFHQ